MTWKRVSLLSACVLVAALTLTGCQDQKPVMVDAPQLAYSLRWVGVCAVLCSTIGGVCLVLAARNGRK